MEFKVSEDSIMVMISCLQEGLRLVINDLRITRLARGFAVDTGKDVRFYSTPSSLFEYIRTEAILDLWKAEEAEEDRRMSQMQFESDLQSGKLPHLTRQRRLRRTFGPSTILTVT